METNYATKMYKTAFFLPDGSLQKNKYITHLHLNNLQELVGFFAFQMSVCKSS